MEYQQISLVIIAVYLFSNITTERLQFETTDKNSHTFEDTNGSVVITRRLAYMIVPPTPVSFDKKDPRPIINFRKKVGQDGESRNMNGSNNPCGSRYQYCRKVKYIEDIGLRWSQRVQNGTGFFVRSQNGQRKYVPLGYREPNQKYGSCKAPNGNRGFCRHLEHCVLDDFRSDFVKFLEYRCQIPYGEYAGVCCPEGNNVDEKKIPENLPYTTFRPRLSTSTFPSRNPNNIRPMPSYNRLCGYSEQKNSRIVGGSIADPKTWKWMAAIIRAMPETGDKRKGQFCGGVLISEFHILTAAHCIIGLEVNDFKIRLGEYDFSQRRLSSNPQDFEVLSKTVHEQYNRYSYKNDIAILRLARSAYFNDEIRPICLPSHFEEEETYENEIATVIGWGTIYYGGPVSDALLQISVPIWNQKDCINAYTQPIEDTNLCAGVKSGSRDSCQGDSGGPLQLQGSDQLWRVIGIVSWGIRCSEPGHPGVYQRVDRKWIEKNML